MAYCAFTQNDQSMVINSGWISKTARCALCLVFSVLVGTGIHDSAKLDDAVILSVDKRLSVCVYRPISDHNVKRSFVLCLVPLPFLCLTAFPGRVLNILHKYLHCTYISGTPGRFFFYFSHFFKTISCLDLRWLNSAFRPFARCHILWHRVNTARCHSLWRRGTWHDDIRPGNWRVTNFFGF